MQITSLGSSLSLWLKVYCPIVCHIALSCLPVLLPRQLQVAPLQIVSVFINSYDTFENRACKGSSAREAHFPDIICFPSKY